MLIVAGNSMYGGAGILAAQGAVYSGAGLVTLASDPVNRSALHARLPECMFLDWTNHGLLLERLSQFDTILIGPGLGLDGVAYTLMEMVLSGVSASQNVIIDGDGITLYAKGDLPRPDASLYFTPHAGEWERLSGLTDDCETNLEKAKELGATVILKGHRTRVFAEDEVWQNMYGSSAMATGGMGDTLAGIIAGLMKQAAEPIEGVLAAVFFHSYIGDILAKKRFVVLPSQIATELPIYLKIFSEMSESAY